MLHGLDLFSGVGGLTLALRPWVRPVAYCENDRYCQGVILSRICDLSLPDAGIWDDVRTLKGSDIVFDVDIIYGGFPCQDISCAGHGVGLEGKRSGLFFEMLRLIKEVKPKFVFLENVPAIRTRGAHRVGQELARAGYDCRWDIISASEIGAPHIRKRWFLLAYSLDQRSRLGKNFKTPYAYSETLWVEQGRGHGKSRKFPNVDSPNGESWLTAWASQGGFKPRVSRTGNGVPFAVERDRAMGNAVVPLQAREAFKRLMGLECRKS